MEKYIIALLSRLAVCLMLQDHHMGASTINTIISKQKLQVLSSQEIRGNNIATLIKVTSWNKNDIKKRQML